MLVECQWNIDTCHLYTLLFEFSCYRWQQCSLLTSDTCSVGVMLLTITTVPVGVYAHQVFWLSAHSPSLYLLCGAIFSFREVFHTLRAHVGIALCVYCPLSALLNVRGDKCRYLGSCVVRQTCPRPGGMGERHSAERQHQVQRVVASVGPSCAGVRFCCLPGQVSGWCPSTCRRVLPPVGVCPSTCRHVSFHLLACTCQRVSFHLSFHLSACVLPPAGVSFHLPACPSTCRRVSFNLSACVLPPVGVCPSTCRRVSFNLSACPSTCRRVSFHLSACILPPVGVYPSTCRRVSFHLPVCPSTCRRVSFHLSACVLPPVSLTACCHLCTADWWSSCFGQCLKHSAELVVMVAMVTQSSSL